jgi:hypothetical protein
MSAAGPDAPPGTAVYVVNGTSTSAGPGPGPKTLPVAEAAWLLKPAGDCR